ncbi:MAG: LacI family DNA-binding transcriptional regulator [Rhodoluna sp.]|nr:LacI family DNA-binding transcriptional regulator [Rhodoluna sp.]
MAKRPTIHDVAERAGVSKSLVALVFKSDTGVSQKRREIVLTAAKELGYTPNAWASALRSGDNGFIGIIVADFHNPLFTEFADLARKTFAARGIFSFVTTASVSKVDGVEKIDPVPIQHMLDLKPSSLLIVGGLAGYEPFKKIHHQIPIVQVLSSQGDLSSAVSVRSDESSAMGQIVGHLASLGHKEVVYIGPEQDRVGMDRFRAFTSEAKKLKLKSHFISTGSDKDEASGLAGGLAAMRLNPTAIVCYNDNVAFGVQDALARTKSKAAVTGYDNTFVGALERINLTSIDQNQDSIVLKVQELLANQTSFRQQRGKEILIHPRLIIRNSSTANLTKR